MNPDALEPQPVELDYAESPAPVSPEITAGPGRLVINLGSPSPLIFVMRISGMSLLIALLAVTSVAGGIVARIVSIPLAVICVLAMYRAARNRLAPDVIVADSTGVVARGPTTGLVAYAWKDVASFRVRRTGLFGWAQLCVKPVPGAFADGEEQPLAWADLKNVTQAVEALNEWLGPRSTDATGRIPTRVRVRNWAVVIGIAAASVAPAIVIGKAAIDLPNEQSVKADLYFVAAICIGVTPPFLTAVKLAIREQ